MYFRYWLLITFLRLFFFLLCVWYFLLVYRSLNSLSLASSGWESFPTTLNHLPQQLHPASLQFSDTFHLYTRLVFHIKGGIEHMPGLAWFLLPCSLSSLCCTCLISLNFPLRDFGSFDYANLANLLHPGFQGVRWARDQPMPGPFPAPPPSQVKGPGNEVVWEHSIPGVSLEYSLWSEHYFCLVSSSILCGIFVTYHPY